MKLNENIKITGVKGSNTEKNILIMLGEHGIVAPKIIFDFIFMLNGLFDEGEIDINFESAEAFFWIPLTEKKSEQCINMRNLREYTAHFTTASSTSVMLCLLLKKFGVRSIFYGDATIRREDIINNIYYTDKDEGKSVSQFLKDIEFLRTDFDTTFVPHSKSIIINSDAANWKNSDRCTVINTWNYKNIQLDKFKLFSHKADISQSLKSLVENYNSATQAIYDIIYTINETRLVS